MERLRAGANGRAVPSLAGGELVERAARAALPPRARPARPACPARARAGRGRVRSPYADVAGQVRAERVVEASRPSSRSWRTSTAVMVLVIEPIRYCTSGPGSPVDAAVPRRSTPARRRGPRPPTTEGSRPVDLRARPAARRSRRAVSVGDRRSRGELIRRTPRAAGRRRPGCGRRRPGRCGATGGQYLSGSTPVGKTATLAGVGAVPLADERARGVRRAAQRRRPPAVHSPAATRSISPRIAIIASQNRSISARSSDSVGSTISVPATGKRHRRRVEAVVDQPLGDVVDGDAGAPW